MGFYISSLFYPKELRQLIKELDAEGCLNKRPLWELERFVLSFNAFASLPVWVYLYKYGSATLFSSAMICPLFGLIYSYIMVYTLSHRTIIPYTVGTFANAIVSKVHYNSITLYIYRRPGLCVYLSRLDTPVERPEHFYFNGLHKKVSIRMGQTLPIVVNPYKSKYFCPVFEELKSQFSLNANRKFEELVQ